MFSFLSIFVSPIHSYFSLARQVATSLSFTIGTTPIAVNVPLLDVYSVSRPLPEANLSSVTPAGVPIDERLNQQLASAAPASASAGSATVLRLGGPPLAACASAEQKDSDPKEDVARTRCPPVLRETHEFLVCVSVPPAAAAPATQSSQATAANAAKEQWAATRLALEARCEYPCPMASRQSPLLKWLLDGKVCSEPLCNQRLSKR